MASLKYALMISALRYVVHNATYMLFPGSTNWLTFQLLPSPRF